MNLITLQQLLEMLQSLPYNIRIKEIAYLDLSHMTETDLEELKNKLIKSSEDRIQECQN